jgi:type I restriction enzyme, S subunit
MPFKDNGKSKDRQSILSYIHEEAKKIKFIEENIEREITLLREYRTRLIADVVTGKLDVREAAKDLPEAIEEVILEDLSDIEEELTDEEIPEIDLSI